MGICNAPAVGLAILSVTIQWSGGQRLWVLVDGTSQLRELAVWIEERSGIDKEGPCTSRTTDD